MRRRAQWSAIFGLVILGLLWRTAPGREVRGAARSAVQSTVDAMTGKTAVDVAQGARRDLVQSNVGRALRQYRALNGREPSTLHDLVDAGFLGDKALVDEWGRALECETDPEGFVVRGLGADGRAGTDDDWILTP